MALGSALIMTLDPKKLRLDAKRLNKARPRSPIGRNTTGTTDAIRAALPTIYELRKAGVSWPAIAEALADQGVVQGKNRTRLTTHRLTALVTQIKNQERRKAEKSSDRGRSDAVDRTAPTLRKLSLASELAARPKSDPSPALSEDELRQSAFDKLKSVMKMD
jgi:hypothetical protein